MMLDTGSLTIFITAGLLLNITPGPDVLYIVGRSIGQGRAAGVSKQSALTVRALEPTAADPRPAKPARQAGQTALRRNKRLGELAPNGSAQTAPQAACGPFVGFSAACREVLALRESAAGAGVRRRL